MHLSDFVPLPFLKNAHSQTLAGWLSSPQRPLRGTTIERVPLEGEDFTTVHLHEPSGVGEGTPTLILIHGLEGNACRPYMLRISKKAAARGFRTARMNMRLCGDAESLSSSFYNSTHSSDVYRLCEWLHERYRESPIWVAGFSLGGNLALKMAGEGGAPGLAGVIAISPPIDLHLASKAVSHENNRHYHRFFVKSLVNRAQRYLRKFSRTLDAQLNRAMSIADFDAAFTVPLGGFTDLNHYYTEGSPRRLLDRIECSTTIIASKDDPLVPFESFEGIGRNIRLIAPHHGGHLGFIGYRLRGDRDFRWAENRLLDLVQA
jgi:predicted alpha/beta-fold hydrolase